MYFPMYYDTLESSLYEYFKSKHKISEITINKLLICFSMI